MTPPDQMPREWRCFHCDEVFVDREAAARHFGPRQDAVPGCAIDLEEYRRMEALHEAHLAEDTALHRALYVKSAEAAHEARRMEEVGYGRGLADAKRWPETLGLMPRQEAMIQVSENGDEIVWAYGSLAACNAIEALHAEARQRRGETVVGVGSGDGQLFLRGTYEAAKRAQQIILEWERLAREVERLRCPNCDGLGFRCERPRGHEGRCAHGPKIPGEGR